MSVHEDIEQKLRDFHSAKKVIGLTCIAPIIAAKVFGPTGVKLTLGGTTDNFPYAGSIEAAKSFGAEMAEMDVSKVCTDWSNNIVTTPAYMQGDAKPHQIADGIDTFMRRVDSLVKQREAAQTIAAKDQQEAASRKSNETDLMKRLIDQSVKRIWQDYDKTGDDHLTFEESKEIIRDSFGSMSSTTITDSDL